MSTIPPTSTGTAGSPISGTPGTSIKNTTSAALNSNQFLDLMMAELTHQDPTNPNTSDPTQYLSQLAQMTSVEQETNTAQSTAQSASAQAVTAAVSLIGDTISYVDQSTGKSVTGTVDSVQITSSGPTLTVAGVAGIAPSTVTNVAPTSSGTGTSGTTAA